MNLIEYQYPLHSFTLLSADTVLDGDAARYVIEVPEGLLVVPERLRRRAAGMNVLSFYKMTQTVLPFHGQYLDYFARRGMDAAWADSYRHWSERMMGLAEGRTQLVVGKQTDDSFLIDPVSEGQRLWRDLRVLTCQAGLGKKIVSGRAPHGALKLQEGLQQVAAAIAVPERAARLARRGFGPKDHEELRRVIDAIPGRRMDSHEHRQRVHGLTDVLTVIRGGLLGDTLALRDLARAGLPRAEAEKLQLKPLMPPRRKRKTKDAATAAPVPAGPGPSPTPGAPG